MTPSGDDKDLIPLSQLPKFIPPGLQAETPR